MRTMKVPRYPETRIIFGFSPNVATAKPSPANASAVRMQASSVRLFASESRSLAPSSAFMGGRRA